MAPIVVARILRCKEREAVEDEPVLTVIAHNFYVLDISLLDMICTMIYL